MPPVSGLPQNGGAKKRLPDDGTDQVIHEEGGSAHRKSSLRDSSLLRKRHDKRFDRTKVQYESARVPHIPANRRRCHDRLSSKVPDVPSLLLPGGKLPTGPV